MYNKSGFSLIEILVAVALIGLLAAFVFPNLGGSKPKEDREKFVLELNVLTGFALQNAIKTRKVQQVFFNFAKKEISLNIATGKEKYEPVKKTYAKTKIKMIDQLELKNFYIQGKDEAHKLKLGVSGDAFFLVADGNCQSIIINYLDNNQDKSGRNKQPKGLVLNPFSAQFEVFDEYKKP